eukprot:Hpha_TRINITY_DN15408_c0_g1::TRINITY_DN15408_c0_g1_i1::g.174201::m.174201/K17231/IYD, DEHAL1; iodotyrosine deiodinase
MFEHATSNECWPVLVASLIATNVAWGLLWLCSLRNKASKTGGKMTDQDWDRMLDAKEKRGREDSAGAIAALESAAHVPYKAYKRHPEQEMIARSGRFYAEVNARRTVRTYSPETFPIEVLEKCVLAASTAPSGANLQPWSYVIVSNDKLKSGIRDAVEREEEINYARRMRESWKQDLAHLGTNSSKPYLEEAPYLVCVFKHSHRLDEDGEKLAVYYPEQSVGISVGIFMAAVHNAGLVTLTSTPMGAEASIKELLGRPDYERLYLLMPVGYPSRDCVIPNITRKPLDEVFFRA